VWESRISACPIGVSHRFLLVGSLQVIANVSVCADMAELAEVVITSDSNGHPGTAKVWNLRTGALIYTLHVSGIECRHSVGLDRI